MLELGRRLQLVITSFVELKRKTICSSPIIISNWNSIWLHKFHQPIIVSIHYQKMIHHGIHHNFPKLQGVYPKDAHLRHFHPWFCGVIWIVVLLFQYYVWFMTIYFSIAIITCRNSPMLLTGKTENPDGYFRFYFPWLRRTNIDWVVTFLMEAPSTPK